MRPILDIQSISKKFLLNHEGAHYFNLRDKLSNLFKKNEIEEFWALKNITFQVYQGESIGIVGRNGAGKSTLLKILSRITPPTDGRVVARGRIASLLEVGTGFHQELSGRENIFMNGSILGMRRTEIKQKFDEIVEFSGVEKFLDTQLKHYSSGMQLRLAFAVAANPDPEILIIDEVLAVGDAEFQKKCIGKMEDVTRSGRTILFVSHNMGAIKSLCQKAILLENGEIKSIGTTNEIVNAYLHEKIVSKIIHFNSNKNLPGFAESICVEDMNGNALLSIPVFEPFNIVIHFTIVERIKHFIIAIGMTTIDDVSIRTVWSNPVDIEPGIYKAVFSEKNIFFSKGKYKLIVGLSSREESFQYLPDATIIEFESIIDKERILNDSSGLLLNTMDIKIVAREY